MYYFLNIKYRYFLKELCAVKTKKKNKYKYRKCIVATIFCNDFLQQFSFSIREQNVRKSGRKNVILVMLCDFLNIIIS